MFITVPREVNNFCAATNKTSVNLGKMSVCESWRIIFITFPPRWNPYKTQSKCEVGGAKYRERARKLPQTPYKTLPKRTFASER